MEKLYIVKAYSDLLEANAFDLRPHINLKTHVHQVISKVAKDHDVFKPYTNPAAVFKDKKYKQIRKLVYDRLKLRKSKPKQSQGGERSSPRTRVKVSKFQLDSSAATNANSPGNQNADEDSSSLLQTETDQESAGKVLPSQETFGKDSLSRELDEQLEKENEPNTVPPHPFRDTTESTQYFKRVIWNKQVTLEEIAEAREYRKHHKRMYDKITRHLQFLKEKINEALEADSEIDTSIIEKSDYGSGYKQGR